MKVFKTTARKAHKAGKSVWVLPCKTRVENAWIMAHKVEGDFDKFINSYKCCNNELGRYAAYYLKD